MTYLDLTLLQEGPDTAAITAVAQSALGSDTFTLTLPPELLQALRKWTQRHSAFCGSEPQPLPGAQGQPPCTNTQAQLQDSDTELTACLQDWLDAPPWTPLQRLLKATPGLPLRLRLRAPSTQAALIRLPWESLRLQRPIWRLATRAPDRPGPANSHRPIRRPRLLLLVGFETNLQLDAEVAQLQHLQAHGGLELTILRGTSSSLTALAEQLRHPQGWDVLAYLGHSLDDPRSGGRLRLSDGHWLSGQQLRQQLESVAPTQRPALVLLNSCLGLDLADSCLAAGVAWVVCFRDKVPDRGASLAFDKLVQQLLAGHALTDAVAMVRRQLSEGGPAGCALQLSAVGADSAPPLQLPLGRQQRFRLRLAGSRPCQALVAVISAVLALAMDVAPSRPPSAYLLDRRLWVQQQWRQLSQQPGPLIEPLPVLLLDRELQDQLGPTTRPNRVSHRALAEVLRLVAPAAVPVIGLDVVLDESNGQQTEDLVQLMRQQQRLVVVGYFGEGSEISGAGRRSQQRVPSGPPLQQADVGVVTDGSRDSTREPQPAPLQLMQDLRRDNFATQLAQTQANGKNLLLPGMDSVIDWSLNWGGMIHVLPSDVSQYSRARDELKALQAPLLVIGTNGRINQKEVDRFQAPSTLLGSATQTKAWGLGDRSLPGPIVQAVLIQSLRLQHWLKPMPVVATTALTAGLGVLVAAGWSQRRQRLAPLLILATIATPLALQMAVSKRILIPLTLPLITLATTALIRRD